MTCKQEENSDAKDERISSNGDHLKQVCNIDKNIIALYRRIPLASPPVYSPTRV